MIQLLRMTTFASDSSLQIIHNGVEWCKHPLPGEGPLIRYSYLTLAYILCICMKLLLLLCWMLWNSTVTNDLKILLVHEWVRNVCVEVAFGSNSHEPWISFSSNAVSLPSRVSGSVNHFLNNFKVCPLHLYIFPNSQHYSTDPLTF